MTTCPTCHEPIRSDDINVATDVALCRGCGHTARLSSLLEAMSPVAPPIMPEATPGTWDTDDGMERRIGASTRSPIAFFLFPFMLVWSGFSLGGLYGSQIVSGKFDLFKSLFGIPFVLGTLIFGSIALMAIFGKVEVILRGDDGEVFIGIGPVGWTRRFLVSEFSSVREIERNGRNATQGSIVLEGTRRLSFGGGIPSQRRFFIAQTLRGVFHDHSP